MKQEIKERFEMIRRGEVPEGYRLIINEIIPEDWEVNNLGDMGRFSKGKGIAKYELVEVGFNCVRYGEIYTKHDYIIKKFYSFIDEGTANNSVLINKNDVLLAGSGETPEEIGKAVVYLGNEKVYAGGDIVIFRPTEPINSAFLAYLLNSSSVNKQKFKLGEGYSVVHIYQDDLKSLQLFLPPMVEQRQIADILTTWDRAIELKEQLIEKKKKLKKSLMQNLLTGKVRLPGFSNRWETVNYSDIFYKIPTKNKQINTSEYLKEGLYPVVDQGKEKVMAFSNDKSKVISPPSDGIIIFGDHTREVKYIDFDFIAGADGTQLLCANNKCDNKFYYYHLLTKRIPDAGYSRHYKYLKDMTFNYPELKEQKAIAEVLFTAEQSIQANETELSILKQQKQGLMQLLLSGIVRVPVENAKEEGEQSEKQSV